MMDEYKNFKEFYDIKLVHDLKDLDQERKQVDRKVIFIGIIAIIIILIIGRLGEAQQCIFKFWPVCWHLLQPV